MRHFLRTILLFLVSLVTKQAIKGQAIPDTTTARQTIFAEVSGLGSSNKQTPFWFRSRQYGIIPLSSPTGILQAGITRQFGNYQNPRKIYVKVGLEGVATIGSSPRIILPVAYASVLWRKFELYGGRRREVFGLVDTLLTSGSYAWSGNALPLYKIQFGTHGYWPLNFTKGFLAINALYAHGWFSNTDSVQRYYLHQKAFYIRIGKPRGRIKLYTGVLHNVQWSGYSSYLSDGLAVNHQLPSTIKDYLYLISAKNPDSLIGTNYTAQDGLNQFGNHLGSIDLAVEIDLNNWSLFSYYQHAYEDKSGVAMVNLPDGLYGIKIKNKIANSVKVFRINQVLMELLTTMSQSGSLTNTGKYDGQDDYFNNDQYLDGWTHKRNSIGNPFLSIRQEVDQSWLSLPGQVRPFINNRVQVIHVGLIGSFASGVQLLTHLSLSHNYGTYRRVFPTRVNQLSGSLWLTYTTKWLGGATVKTALAMDQGGLYNNSAGVWISIQKTWSRK